MRNKATFEFLDEGGREYRGKIDPQLLDRLARVDIVVGRNSQKYAVEISIKENPNGTQTLRLLSADPTDGDPPKLSV